MNRPTAIIAGTGNLPIEACKKLKSTNTPFFIVSLFPEENGKELQRMVVNPDDLIEKEFCKPSEILKLIKNKNSDKVLMIGKVDKKNLLKKLKFDWLAIKSLGSLFSKSDKTIMEKILSIFEEHDIQVIHQSDVLDSLIVSPGIIVGKLTDTLHKDIQIGIDAALKISELDIGQTVVIKNGMILAIEAIEGTDRCIKRGIELGNGNIIVCKAASISQNQKYDLPTLGTKTLKDIKPGDISVIAWQSSRTLIENKKEFAKLANSLGITLVAV